jgi:hypothetical protein
VIVGCIIGFNKLTYLIPTIDILDGVGLKAVTPQQIAGYLQSPNISTPNPIPIENVPTKAASPPQEPPVLNSDLYGLIALPQKRLQVSLVKHDSDIPAH